MSALDTTKKSVTYTADDLTKERIEEIRRLATVEKVDGMLVQEWEVVALCDLSLRQLDRHYEDLEHEHLGCHVAKTGIYAEPNRISVCPDCVPPQALVPEPGGSSCPKCLTQWRP